MWFLDIKCIALAVACVVNPDALPNVKREFPTKLQCERAMDNLNMHWRPAQGAWKMNCVQVREN